MKKLNKQTPAPNESHGLQPKIREGSPSGTTKTTEERIYWKDEFKSLDWTAEGLTDDESEGGDCDEVMRKIIQNEVNQESEQLREWRRKLVAQARWYIVKNGWWFVMRKIKING